MPATLSSLRDRVELMISDATNAQFSTTAVEEGIREALDRYSQARPQQAIGTLTISAEGREIDISSLTGLIDVKRVWLPYDSTDATLLPDWQPFEFWQDQAWLYFPGSYVPQAGDVARIFYAKLQTLSGLDGAGTTTFPAEDETLIAHGAAGYTVLPRGRETTEEVTIDQSVPTSKQVTDWAKMKLGEFLAGLDRIEKLQAGRGGGRARLPRLDRWDRSWS